MKNHAVHEKKKRKKKKEKHGFLKTIALTISGNPRGKTHGPDQLYKTFLKTNSNIGVLLRISRNFWGSYSTEPRDVFRPCQKSVIEYLWCFARFGTIHTI